MPNWCVTSIAMTGKKENVLRLKNDVVRLMETDRKGCADWSFESHSDWLGYFAADLLGISWESIDCRGTIVDVPQVVELLDPEEWKIDMCWETAWAPCYELQKKLAEKYGLKLYFCADESGCCIHETNDVEGRFFSGRFQWDDGMEATDYETFESLAGDFVAEYGGEVHSLEDLEERIANELEDGDDHNIIKYVLVDNEGKPLE